jgi:S-methylmethionine-dependent homocysteine/selenocysteine methylase
VRAAKKSNMPVMISFTVETDGNLPSGESLRDAITGVDTSTDRYPFYYMINCAHPTHFRHAIEPGAAWVERIYAVRANSSTRSHAELNESTVLDEGDPVDFGKQYQALREILPNLHILGGCCGTDPRHVDEIAKACTSA